jgi:hypothetical protein
VAGLASGLARNSQWKPGGAEGLVSWTDRAGTSLELMRSNSNTEIHPASQSLAAKR